MKKGLYRLEVYYKQNATESEKEVLRFLISRTREAIEMDIHTLAKTCYCSAATIVRICKKNGFSGFKELKIALANDLNFSKQLIQAELTSSTEEKIPNIVVNALNANITAIQNVSLSDKHIYPSSRQRPRIRPQSPFQFLLLSSSIL